MIHPWRQVDMGSVPIYVVLSYSIMVNHCVTIKLQLFVATVELSRLSISDPTPVQTASHHQDHDIRSLEAGCPA